MTTTLRSLASLAPLAMLLACSTESDELTFEVQAHSFKNSDWSPPVNFGPMINTSANEAGPTLSHDGLTLYFASNRTGGFGGNDIWVAQRACLDCPWDPPANLGPVINTAGVEAGPSLSIDEHLLFFTSNRAGGQGANDIWVTRRAKPSDAFGWEPPVNLGPAVNTAAVEAGSEYVVAAEEGAASLYFNRNPVGGTTDIYVAPVARDGTTRGDAVLVAELSDPDAFDQGTTLRTDGREVLFFSTRPGGLGSNDLWTSTRRSVHDPWSPPVNLESLNSTASDQQPSLSSDGRTLLFASGRPGGSGGLDIWMSTRTPSGK